MGVLDKNHRCATDLCPEHSQVNPKRTLCRVTIFCVPVNVRLKAVGLSGEAMVTAQVLPVEDTVKGLEGDTTAPTGSPVIVMVSPAVPPPKIRAGVTSPPFQGVEEDSTALSPKAHGSGPHPPHTVRGGGESSKGSSSQPLTGAHRVKENTKRRGVRNILRRRSSALPGARRLTLSWRVVYLA